MIAQLKLGTKFTLLLSLVLVAGTLFAGLSLWQTLERRAETEVAAQGLLLIEMMNSVRTYTSNHVQPLLADELATEPAFVSESVPAFSAREVFETFRATGGRDNFVYKEAALNPTNPRDQADAFEADILRQVARSGAKAEVTGFRTVSGERLFYIARPLSVQAESCLVCHGDPEAAPASLIATYGDEGGFDWEVGQVVAAQMIYVPADAVYDTALRSFSQAMLVFMAVFAMALVVLNYMLRAFVIRPVGLLGTVAEKIGADELETADLEDAHLAQVAGRLDELGQLAQVVRSMAKEVTARTAKLKRQIQELRIEIDHAKKGEQVKEIVETDFFRELQVKARKVREQRDKMRDE